MILSTTGSITASENADAISDWMEYQQAVIGQNGPDGIAMALDDNDSYFAHGALPFVLTSEDIDGPGRGGD